MSLIMSRDETQVRSNISVCTQGCQKGHASAPYMCMRGEWATKCTNAACALAVLLMVSNAVSTCSPSCLLSFGPSDGGHVRLSVSLCLGGDTRSPARLRTPLWLLVRKVAAAHVARMGDPCISKKSLNFENSGELWSSQSSKIFC